MATRASVVIHDEWNDEPICEVYTQYDGYPSGFGQKLIDFCKEWKIINGINDQTADQKYANGMGDFAAQLIKHFKQDIGGIYMIAVGKDQGQDYRYVIKCSKRGEAFNSKWEAKPLVYVEGFENMMDALREEAA